MRRDGETLVVLVRGDTHVASWALPGASNPDLALVDRLARLQLVAPRLGCSVRLRGPRAELCDLLDLVGLADVITDSPPSGGEVGGEAEDGEQPGVEEAVMPDDPLA